MGDGGQKADLFPSLAVAQLLVECGARLNATNALESTPLHTAACLPNFNKEIVELLLAEGSHMDMRNVQGVRPSQLLAAKVYAERRSEQASAHARRSAATTP